MVRKTLPAQSRTQLGATGPAKRRYINPPTILTVVAFIARHNGCMDKITLQRIFEKTGGRCHLTGQPLTFKNYGIFGAPGGWEIDHSIPVSRGGTDHLNNLYPALISANRAKCDSSSRSARNQNGMTRAPMSEQQEQRAHEKNTWAGLGIGAVIGLPFGPLGIGAGAFIGAVLGANAEIK